MWQIVPSDELFDIFDSSLKQNGSFQSGECNPGVKTSSLGSTAYEISNNS